MTPPPARAPRRTAEAGLTPAAVSRLAGELRLACMRISRRVRFESTDAVAPHQFGIAVGTMNFSRNLYSTMLIAVIGAIVLTGVEGGATTTLGATAAEGFRRVFFAAAASLTISLVGLILLEERPLRSREQPAE